MKTLSEIPLFNSLDRSVGDLLARHSAAKTGVLPLLGALISYSLRQGHVCLDLGQIKDSDMAAFIDQDQIKSIQADLGGLELIGSESDSTAPLILTKSGKLYFHRYWHYEHRLLTAINQRLNANPGPVESDKLNAFFAACPTLGDEQRQAIALSATSPITFISGGPGTGKTTTVLYMLAHLLTGHSGKTLKIGLAAPTGKAAQRIQVSLEQGLQALPLARELKDQMPKEATTLHRLLGFQKNISQFKYNREVPLPLDIVVIDEASMLDLLMFSKLLDALASSTRLILLGDRHQLASVEAGSIFGDLIQSSLTNQLLAEHTVELTSNYRFGNKSTLYQTCEAVKSGASRKAVALLRKNGKEARLKSLPSPDQLPLALKSSLESHFKRIAEAKNPGEALQRLQEVVLLTPLRKGKYGVEGLNQRIDSLMRDRQDSSIRTSHFAGQPILITENNYAQALFNGDLGVIFPSPDNSEELFAYFQSTHTDTLRRFPMAALPGFELAYALTVHKSQGSEYRHVFFLLPPGGSPLITRELIYTAISRSRESVEIWGHTEDLIEGIEKRTLRTSGILDAMALEAVR